MPPPQPSPAGPHETLMSAHVFGVHFPTSLRSTHLLGLPGPPQRKPLLHVPQLSMKPLQPSPAGPHSTPCSWHVRGLHWPPPSPPKPLLMPGPPSPPSALPPPPNWELSPDPHA